MGTPLVAQWKRTHLSSRGRGFDLWSRTKIPHAVGQLSPSATTIELVPQGESPHAQTTEPTRHN